MKSRANIKSHPIHPILIPFPIAFFTGVLLFDSISFFVDEPHFYREVGRILTYAGIIGAVAAAIPGIIDLTQTVPPKSSAKKRGGIHALLNSTMLVIFIIAAIIRANDFSIIIWIMDLMGVGLMMVAGWLGGTLVYRNQIGVDIRYADAGKWKEKHIESSSDLIEVADVDELKLNQMKLLVINKKRIALAKTENGYVAFDDRCTHKGASLAAGSMICGTVQCPWHGSQFDVAQGTVKAGPAKTAIATYPVTEQNGKVFVKIIKS